MGKIQVGEYVRINESFIGKIGIARVTSVDDKYVVYIMFNTDFPVTVPKETIKKHSKNIIDLIEVGDIIQFNDEKYEVIYDKSYNKLGILIPNKDYLAIRHISLEYIFQQNTEVKILTKEQYRKYCCKLEV